MRSAPADIPSLKSLKKVRMGDNISLSSGGYSSSHDELFSSPREVTFYHIQLLTLAYVRLLNSTYENKVTLREQNPPLKCCQPLKM